MEQRFFIFSNKRYDMYIMFLLTAGSSTGQNLFTTDKLYPYSHRDLKREKYLAIVLLKSILITSETYINNELNVLRLKLCR